jgi:hypothetical protein
MRIPNRRGPLILLAPAGLLWLGVLVLPVQAEANSWGFGSDVGFTAGTVNDTVFNLGFNLDYYTDRNFSFGPLMQITPTGDLFQFSFAGAAKYHVRFNNGINLVPFVGFGLIHNDLDQGTGPGRIDESDTSWYIPIGVSLEYQVAHNVALASTIIVNIHDIDLTPALSEADTTSVALMFGFRWGPP